MVDMAFVLVDSSYLKPTLHELHKLLKASVGPKGCFSLLSSGTGSLTLTSTSSRIIQNLSLESPILQFILQSIRSQTESCGDGGLFCGILLCQTLSCTLNCSFGIPKACTVISYLSRLASSELQNSEQLQIKVCLDSILPFISVARSVLFAKHGIFEGKDSESLLHANSQISLLVRAFLQSEASIGKVLLRVDNASVKQCLLNGILYSCSDGEGLVLQGKRWHSVSILLFSVMLTDKLDSKEKESCGTDLPQKGIAQLKAAEIFIDAAVECGIQVIACQKVVHPMLLLRLRRKGILVLQRLGRKMAEAVERLSGATPISDLQTSSLDSLTEFKGSFTSVGPIPEVGEDFILLEGSSDPRICSLLLTSRSPDCGAELKVVAHQVLSALSRVLQDSAVCPGAGCTEMYLCNMLWNKVQKRRRDLCDEFSCTAFQLDTVVQWLQEGLLEASGLEWKGGKLSTDSIYHHAWKGSHVKNSFIETESCNCGLVTSKNIIKLKGSWTFFTLNHQEKFCIDTHAPVETNGFKSIDVTSGVIVDVLSTKRSALNLALDNCVALANIGAVITRVDENI